MLHLEYGWTTDDGLELYAQGWQPETDSNAVVCLVHGLGEHSGRYAHLAAFLNQSGYALMSFDLRGHGKSQGRPGHAPSFEVLMVDISQFLDEIKSRFPDSTRFLYGHSLGGNLVLEFTLRRRPQLAGVVATGPNFRTAFEPPAWKVAFGRFLYGLRPTFTMSNELERPALSRDSEVVQAYINDPLVHDRLTARFGIDLLDSGVWLLDHADELTVPLLLMHGGADRITSVEASREFSVNAGDLCTLKIWDGFFHEIHNEPEKEDVFAYLLKWLKSEESHSNPSIAL